MVAKAETFTNVLRSLAKVSWGADYNVCVAFFRACIRSQLDYGCSIYESSSNTKLHIVQVVQNKALRICLGDMRSIPFGILAIESQVPPTKLRRGFLTNKLILKWTSNSSFKILEGIEDLSVGTRECGYWRKRGRPPLVEAFEDTATLRGELRRIECIMGYFDGLSLPSVIPCTTSVVQGTRARKCETS